MKITKEYLRELVDDVSCASKEIHKKLGPGLDKQIYLKCLLYELRARNLAYEVDVAVPIKYGGAVMATDLTCDLLVSNLLAVEVKAVEEVIPIHISEILTYMKFLESPMGLIINFNCVDIVVEGQKTFVNEFYKELS